MVLNAVQDGAVWNSDQMWGVECSAEMEKYPSFVPVPIHCCDHVEC